MIVNASNFGLTVFSILMFDKMSKATWSVKHQDAEETKQTTQMDREVAAKWFDHMIPDKDFQFRNFTRNIPRETIDSMRSSFIRSADESIILKC